MTSNATLTVFAPAPGTTTGPAVSGLALSPTSVTGGATAQGVTADAVYISIPTPEGKTNNYEALRKFFNKRFQFYGRQLVFGMDAVIEAGEHEDVAAGQREGVDLFAVDDVEAIVPGSALFRREGVQ